MRDVICDVISYCAWSCDMDKIDVKDKIDKILIMNIKREKIKSNIFNIKLYIKHNLGVDFTTC